MLSDIDQHLNAIRQYVRTQLDREVAMTRGNKGHRVLVGGICAEQPAAAGDLPLLYESFLSELPVDMLFHDSERHPVTAFTCCGVHGTANRRSIAWKCSFAAVRATAESSIRA